MKFFNKKYLLLLAGLLFVSTVTLDPFHHDFFESDHSEAECHLCINEISDPIKSESGLTKLSISNILNVTKVENFTSYNSKNFHSRAPPKI